VHFAFLPTAQIRILILGGAYNVFHKQQPPSKDRSQRTPTAQNQGTQTATSCPCGAATLGQANTPLRAARLSDQKSIASRARQGRTAGALAFVLDASRSYAKIPLTGPRPSKAAEQA
jgi:hypothetical protein